MRRFAERLLYNTMSEDDNVYLITGDLGYGLWDNIRDDFSDRFFNVGSSEMVMMGMAVGLAMEGKIPFVYSITPFAIYRPFEMIRNYLDNERIPVKILGGGRDREYGYLGFSHWAPEDIRVLKCFDYLVRHKPSTNEQLEGNWNDIVYNDQPTYVNLKR